MKWKVPLSDVNIGPREIEAVTRVLESGWLSMGDGVKRFEDMFARAMEVKNAIAVTNCTAALHMAQKALGIGDGDEVICPSLTFVATANSVIYSGATPVFADISGEDDLNISIDSLVEKITSRTKAIIVVHYGGYLCDMDRILEIAEKHDLFVIEDAAHAPGAVLDGRKAGTMGDMGCFSFYSNKNMTTGEGGMVVTNSDDFGERLKQMRSHGMTSLTWDRHKGHAYSYDVVDLGYNYRMDEIRAAIGIVQLEKLEEMNGRREKMVSCYRDKLSGLEGITIPFSHFTRGSSHHIFPILLNAGHKRKSFMEEMKKRGVQTSIHYPPVHLFQYYRKRFGYEEGSLPVTEQVGDKEVTLPLYPGMEETEADYVVKAITSHLLDH